jgi:hypothetical protein
MMSARASRFLAAAVVVVVAVVIVENVESIGQ